MIFLFYIVLLISSLFCCLVFYLGIRPITNISENEPAIIKEFFDKFTIVKYTVNK